MSDGALPDRIDVPVAGGTLAAFRLGEGTDQAAGADQGTATAAGHGPSAGSATRAPLVVAAHGITANSRSWAPVARELTGRVELVALDLRGRGASRELPGTYGVGAHADDVLATLDHLGAERAVLAGHSMGAWVAAHVAARHPERVGAVVLVDGGLPLPGAEHVDPQEFLDAFLGPSIARLRERFTSAAAYREFWRAHPAFGRSAVSDADLGAFADHDLIGEPPALRSSVVEEAVRADGADLLRTGGEASGVRARAVMLRAARGLRDEPTPMVPADAAAAWAAEDRDRRELIDVADVNHYTITLGAGAGRVADAIAAVAVAAAE